MKIGVGAKLLNGPQFCDKMSADHLLNHHAKSLVISVGNAGLSIMNKESDSHNFSVHLQKNIIYIK